MVVIYRTEAFFGAVRVTICALIVGVLFAVMQFPAFAAGSVTLAWQPSADTNVVGYNVYFGGVSETYTDKISVASATSTIVSNLTEGVTYYFAVTAYDDTGLESPFSNEASYAVPRNVGNGSNATTTNTPPTLNIIANLAINENAGEQTVNLSGISSGIVSGKQKLKITAASSDHALIPAPKVKYTSVNPTGTLTFAPKKNATGTATITVTANNGEKTDNLATQTFIVTILAPSTPLAAIKTVGQDTMPSDTMSPMVTLALAAHVNGQFTLTVSGSSDQECIIQASTNLVNWVPVWTNRPPFTYTDANAGQFNQRFYRSIPAPQVP